ncbi:hypothetical protein PInf_014839 [Phytophthora infestans]|nr:hypothetical protein PInf_014839 [Phytophthora infestans]
MPKLASPGYVVLNIATAGVFNAIYKSYKMVKTGLMCTFNMFNIAEGISRFMRSRQIDTPNGTNEELLAAVYQTDLFLVDLPVAITACLGYPVPQYAYIADVTVTAAETFVKELMINHDFFTVYGWQKGWLFWTSASDSLYRSTKAKEKGSGNGMSFQNWNDPIEDEELRLTRILAEADEEQVADAPATEGEGGEADPRTQGEAGEAAEGLAERAAGGHEERVDLDEDEGLFGTSPRAEENRRMFVTMLGTPQGRASFQEFFRTLADRPTPREEQARARETRETDTTSSGTRRGVSFSLDPSRPSLDPVEETSREATPAASTEYSREEDPRRGY